MKIDLLSNLTGKVVTKCIAGGSNGSIIVLDIGSDEFTLFIYCSWRISKESKILATWNDNNDPDSGNLTLEAKKLEGELIKEIKQTNFYDLEILFMSHKVLQIFADVFNKGYEDENASENWSLGDKKNDINYSVTSNFEVHTSKYF